MLSQRHTELLKLLWKNSDTFITSQEMARKLEVSDKTIRKDIAIINNEIDESIARVVSKPGSGFYLNIRSEDLLYGILEDHSFFEDQTKNIQEPKERQLYILKLLLFEKDYVLINDLADELFVSRSTISKDINEIKKRIKDYELTIDFLPYKGIYISGEELKKRHFILNFFFVRRFKNNLESLFNEKNFMKDITIEEIYIIVLDEVRESNFKVSDYILNNIVLHISLSIKRIQDGFGFEKQINKQSIISENTLNMANRILKKIEEIIGFEFPEEEANYLSLYFQKIKYNHYKEKTPIQSEMERQLYDVLKAIDKDTQYKMREDHILFNGLFTHMKQLFFRINQEKKAINPLLEDIKEKYSDTLRLTEKYFSKMPLLENKQMDEDEWGYLTLHLVAYIERFKSKSKLKVLVICATGQGSSQMLKARLKNEFGSKIKIIDVISYYEINNHLLDDIDLIISSINLSRTIMKKPVVNVSVFLDNEDIQKINRTIKQKIGNKKQLTKAERKNETKKSVLSQSYFDSKLFLYIDERMNKDDLLKKMIQQLKKVSESFDKNTLFNQLRLRERLNSVAFSDSIAVPHPINGITESMHVMIAVVPKGVYWDKEHPNIRLVFLLSPERANSGSLEEVSRAIVPLIENEEAVEQLINAKTFEQFLEKFLNL